MAIDPAPVEPTPPSLWSASSDGSLGDSRCRQNDLAGISSGPKARAIRDTVNDAE